ncbi:hypothetical protein D3C72_2414840 [compost metagenome]
MQIVDGPFLIHLGPQEIHQLPFADVLIGPAEQIGEQLLRFPGRPAHQFTLGTPHLEAAEAMDGRLMDGLGRR